MSTLFRPWFEDSCSIQYVYLQTNYVNKWLNFDVEVLIKDINLFIKRNPYISYEICTFSLLVWNEPLLNNNLDLLSLLSIKYNNWCIATRFIRRDIAIMFLLYTLKLNIYWPCYKIMRLLPENRSCEFRYSKHNFFKLFITVSPSKNNN